jgi:hypothetical protein
MTGSTVQDDAAAQVQAPEAHEITCRIKWFGVSSDLSALVGVTQQTGENEHERDIP